MYNSSEILEILIRIKFNRVFFPNVTKKNKYVTRLPKYNVHGCTWIMYPGPYLDTLHPWVTYLGKKVKFSVHAQVFIYQKECFKALNLKVFKLIVFFYILKVKKKSFETVIKSH